MCARLVAEWRPRVAEGVEGPLVEVGSRFFALSTLSLADAAFAFA